ncbi:hypothetical protein CHKEEEPN_4001 [Methylorubrum podarium]|nr:hypothetical protein CHKEEEPN_4001 [Methylorubrum podarium]
MMASRTLPSSETSRGVSAREKRSMNGSSSEVARTRSIETSSAWLKRQIVASVGLVSLRSIWLMIDFATPDCSASSERERL